MNNDWAVVLSALMGRDVSKEIAALAEARAAIGAALNRDQQIFVSANWPSMSLWLASDGGKESARLVVSEWEDWMLHVLSRRVDELFNHHLACQKLSC